MTRRLALLSLVLLTAVATGACGNSGTTTSPTTTSTTQTELFTGTLSPKGSAFYSFTVTTTGAVSVTLASATTAKIGPAGSPKLSIALGVPSGFGCSATSSVDATPGLTAQLTSGSSADGIYCVNVSDPGSIATDTLFVIRIVHT
jgi:hypothetical protein